MRVGPVAQLPTHSRGAVSAPLFMRRIQESCDLAGSVKEDVKAKISPTDWSPILSWRPGPFRQNRRAGRIASRNDLEGPAADGYAKNSLRVRQRPLYVSLFVTSAFL